MNNDKIRSEFEAWTNGWYDLSTTEMSGSYKESFTYHAFTGFQAGYSANRGEVKELEAMLFYIDEQFKDALKSFEAWRNYNRNKQALSDKADL